MPTIFVDFDYTAFATHSFKEWCKAQPGGLAALVTKAVPFRPNELARFVHPDAQEFLRQNDRDSLILVSSFIHKTTDDPTNETFQRRKIEASGIVPRFRETHIIGQDKGAYFAQTFGKQVAGIFIDDMPSHLASVQKHCPRITCVHIDRAGRGGWNGPTITTFEALHTLIEKSTFD